MNPRALAVWSLSAVTIALSTGSPVYRTLVLLCALNVLVAFRRPGVSLRGLLIALGVAAVIAIATTTLASHTGADAFLVLPAGIPVIGGSLTLEAAVFGASTGLGIAAAVLAAAALSLVLLPHEFVDALPSDSRGPGRPSAPPSTSSRASLAAPSRFATPSACAAGAHAASANGRTSRFRSC